MNLTVKSIKRTWLDVPFREVPHRNMIRELPHWTIFELCQVELECGVQGLGETMCFYTWGAVTDESVSRAIGRTATQLGNESELAGNNAHRCRRCPLKSGYWG